MFAGIQGFRRGPRVWKDPRVLKASTQLWRFQVLERFPGVTRDHMGLRGTPKCFKVFKGIPVFWRYPKGIGANIFN